MKMFKSIAASGAIVASLLFGTTLANGQIYAPTFNYALEIKIGGEVCFGEPLLNGVAPVNATPGSSAYLVERRSVGSDDFIKDCADETGRAPKTLALVLIKENSQPIRIAVVDRDDLKNNGIITPICIVFEVTENICSFIDPGEELGVVVPAPAQHKKSKNGKDQKVTVTYCETWKVVCGSSAAQAPELSPALVDVQDEGQMCLVQEETISVPPVETARIVVPGTSLVAAQVSGKIVLCCHEIDYQQTKGNVLDNRGRIFCLEFNSKGSKPLALDSVDLTLVNAAKK